MVNANSSGSASKRRDLFILGGLLVIIVLLNFVGSFFFRRFDLTSEKRYTLSESTRKTLSALDDEIYFRIYLGGNLNPAFTRLKNETKEILDEFRAYSNNQIQYEFIVPGEGLTREESMNVERQLYEKGIVPEQVIDSRDKNSTSQTLIWPGAIVSHKGRETAWQIFRHQLGVEPEVSINNSVEELEYSLMSTIRKLQREKRQEVTFIEGHDELDTLHQYDFMKALSEFYTVNRTPILGKLNALEGTDAIVISQPDSAFSDKDKFIIDQYIMKGGKVLWLIDPVQVNRDTFVMKGYSIGLTAQLNLDDMLFKYGVRLNPVLVQDMQCARIPINVGFTKGAPNFKYFPWIYSPLVMPDVNHPIVRNLDLIRFDFLSTLDTVTAKGIKKTVLLRTSKYSKIQPTPARISLAMSQHPPKEIQFNQKYLSVACLLEGEFKSFVENRLPSALLNDTGFKYIEKGKHTKMIVVADGDVARNEYRRSSGTVVPLGKDMYTGQQFANKTFLLNCVNYLLDDEGLLQLRSREIKLRQLDPKKVQTQRGKWQMTNVGLPLMIIAGLGLVQFWYRKRKYAA